MKTRYCLYILVISVKQNSEEASEDTRSVAVSHGKDGSIISPSQDLISFLQAEEIISEGKLLAWKFTTAKVQRCKGKCVAGQIFSFSLENTEPICLVILYHSCAQRHLDICLAAFLVSSGNTNENYKPLIFSLVLLSIEQHLKTITLLHSRSR